VTLVASLDVIPQPSLDCVRIRSMEHLGSLPLPHISLNYHRANVIVKDNMFVPISSICVDKQK
jgi:hypothetical protein